MKETTTLHWHGMKLPAQSRWRSTSTKLNPTKLGKLSLTLSKMQQRFGITRINCIKQLSKSYQGLAGMFIIDDEKSKALKLPFEYGVDDLLVIIQDKDFSYNGRFRYLSGMMDGMMGKKAP